MEIETKFKNLLLISETKNDVYNFFNFKTKIKYNILNTKLFWEMYNILLNEFQFYDCFLAEKSNLYYSILRFDIDIYPLNNIINETNVNYLRLYDNDLINKVIIFLFKEIENLKNEYQNLEDHEKICCVFFKKKWSKKDGFHLIFPYIFCDKNYHLEFYNKLQKFVNDLKYPNIKISIDDVFNKPWILFGSKKNEDSDMYYLTSVYNSSITLISNVSYKNPEIYSINKEINIKKIFIKNNIKIEKNIIWSNNSNVNENLNKIIGCKMMELLSDLRADDYNYWIDIGITLFNIGEGDHRFFSLFDNFSKRSVKYDENKTKELWEKYFKVKNKTIGSLIRYIQMDNPEQYLKNIKEYYKECHFNNAYDSDDDLHFLTLILKGRSAVKISDAFYCKMFDLKYNREFIYSSKYWFMFNGYIYVNVSPQIVKQKIIDLKEFCSDIFNDFIIKYPDLRENVLKIKNKYVSSLENINTIDAIEKFLKTKLNNDIFYNLVNTNQSLMICANGVLDFDTKIFRITTPDDLSTYSTKIFFPIYTDNPLLRVEHEKLRIELYNYLYQLFDTNIEEVLRLLTFSMVNNKSKILVVSMGETNTGKSAWINLLEKTFGDYACTMAKENIYVRSSERGRTKSDIINTKGRKFAFINETSGTERLATDEVKTFVSGGADRFPARDIYEKSSDFTFTVTLWITCNLNELPYIKDEDDAIWDRIKCIIFNSKFDRYAPLDTQQQIEKKHYPRSEKISEFFDAVSKILLHDLFERIKKIDFEKETLYLPNLEKNTVIIKNNNNFIKKFALLKLEECNESFLFTSELYRSYKLWCKDNISFNKSNQIKNYGDLALFEKGILDACQYVKLVTENRTNKFKNVKYIN